VLGHIEDLKLYGSVPGTEIGRYRRDCRALRFLTPLNQKGVNKDVYEMPV